MNRRCAKLLTLWIVPLLLVRAFVPAGFMVTADAGGLSLAFCPSVMAPAQHAGHAGHDAAGAHAVHAIQAVHAGHHADMDHAGHSGTQHESAPCPFSLGAAAALAAIAHVASPAFILGDDVVEFLSAPTFSVGPLRSDRIRGPPSFA